MNRRLIIFYRNPSLGRVKTRLAAGVGDARALAIYLALSRHTRVLTLAMPVSRVVYYSDYIDREDSWKNTEFEKALQQGTDLGARMLNSLETQFKLGHTRVVMIGTDCPDLTPEILNDAYRRLEDADCVLGPAVDGGHYLLGFKHAIQEIFRSVPWGSNQVHSVTLSRLNELGKVVYELPTLADIDTAENLTPELLKKIRCAD